MCTFVTHVYTNQSLYVKYGYLTISRETKIHSELFIEFNDLKTFSNSFILIIYRYPVWRSLAITSVIWPLIFSDLLETFFIYINLTKTCIDLKRNNKKVHVYLLKTNTHTHIYIYLYIFARTTEIICYRYT